MKNDTRSLAPLAASILSLGLLLPAPISAEGITVSGVQAVQPGVSVGNLMGAAAGSLNSGIGARSGAFQLAPLTAGTVLPSVNLSAPAGLQPAAQTSSLPQAAASVTASRLGPKAISAGPRAAVAAPMGAPSSKAKAVFLSPERAALGSLQAAGVSIIREEGKSPAANRSVFSRLFDGGKGVAPSAESPVAGAYSAPRSGLDHSDPAKGTYLAQAPELPLTQVSPMWKKAAGAQSKDVAARYQMGEPQILSADGAEFTFMSELSFAEADGQVWTLQAAETGQDKVRRSQWQMKSGVRQSAQVEKGIVWTDQEGDFYYHDAKAGKTFRITPAEGKVDAFAASDDGEFLYVVNNGMLQRWDLSTKKATKVNKDKLPVSEVADLQPVTLPGKDGKPTNGILLRSKGSRVFWIGSQLLRFPVSEEAVYNEFGLGVPLTPAGDKFYLQKTENGTRVWRKAWQGTETDVADIGELPFTVKAVAETPDRGIYLVASQEGLIEWDTMQRRYRVFDIPGLKEAAGTGAIRLQVALDSKGLQVQKAVVTAGDRVYQLDVAEARSFLDTPASQVRLWSQANPMTIADGFLRIGEFQFPIAQKTPKPQGLFARMAGAFLRAVGLRSVPAQAEAMGISEKDWRAVNLPTNKKVIYDTLKAFTLRQHVLYIGETGGGKTYIAEMIAKLTGNDLWMVSMNEYTRNKDLIARETFGEEGKGRTGLTASTVLRWMQEGGILLLDEMHKPLEGVAILNNILQNGEYRLPDGRVIKYDKSKSWVIGTMNPVKPPYKGEPPSGELSSRFGMTLDVKYLPPEEEAALLKIFYGKVDGKLVEKLVAIANELRKAYPETLPLPIAPRTLLHIVEHVQHFPKDSVVDIFTKTYNPSSIVEDPAIAQTIEKVLAEHNLAGLEASLLAEDGREATLRSVLTEIEKKAREAREKIERERRAAEAKKNPPPAPSSRDEDWDYGYDEHAGLFPHLFGNRFGQHRMPPMPFTTPKSNEAQVSQAGESLVKSLEMVARILSSYMGLRLVPFYYLQKHGEDAQNTPRQWRTVLQMEEIQYLPEDLADKDRNVSLGRLAHEIWHLLFSRPELIFDHPEFEDDMAFQALWWAVEDPRVNNLGMAEHPGAKAWIDAAYAKDFAIQDIDLERAQWSQIPLHLQFNYGLIYQWWSGKSDPRITDARVLDALKRARPAIRKAAEESDAARAFELVRDEIWPIYKELLDEAYEQAMKDKARQKQEKQQGEKSEEQDEDQQGQGQGQGEQGEEKESDQDQDGGQGKPGKPKPGKQGKPGQKQDQPLTDEERQKVEKQVKEEMRKKEKEFRDKHSSKMVDQKDKMSDAEKEKRRKEMEELRKKLDKARQKGQPQKGKPQDGKPQDGQPQDGESADGAADKKNEPDKKLSEKQKQRLNKADEEKKDLRNEDHERYRKYFDRVRQLVPVMRHQFMETLKQKIRRRTLRGRDSGDLDPDALHLLPSGNKDVFVEEFMPNKTLYRISLLIDTSGSMSGDKKERAIEGAIMMMEALDKVPGVVFEIVKYDSDPKVLKPFNVKLTPKMKEGIVSSIHSGSGSTEAFNALKEAIERVRQGRGDKMVIMVNDGDPDYNFDRDAYRAMVKAAKDVEIHGIGLGDGAQLVLDLFPPGQGHWVKDAADFAKNLRSILRKKLLGK